MPSHCLVPFGAGSPNAVVAAAMWIHLAALLHAAIVVAETFLCARACAQLSAVAEGTVARTVHLRAGGNSRIVAANSAKAARTDPDREGPRSGSRAARGADEKDRGHGEVDPRGKVVGVVRGGRALGGDELQGGDEDVREESGVSRGGEPRAKRVGVQRGAECDARERGDDARTDGSAEDDALEGKGDERDDVPRDDDGALREVAVRFHARPERGAERESEGEHASDAPHQARQARPAPAPPHEPRRSARRLKREYRGAARHPFRRLGAEQRSQHAQRAVRQRRSAGARPLSPRAGTCDAKTARNCFRESPNRVSIVFHPSSA